MLHLYRHGFVGVRSAEAQKAKDVCLQTRRHISLLPAERFYTNSVTGWDAAGAGQTQRKSWGIPVQQVYLLIESNLSQFWKKHKDLCPASLYLRIYCPSYLWGEEDLQLG